MCMLIDGQAITVAPLLPDLTATEQHGTLLVSASLHFAFKDLEEPSYGTLSLWQALIRSLCSTPAFLTSSICNTRPLRLSTSSATLFRIPNTHVKRPNAADWGKS